MHKTLSLLGTMLCGALLTTACSQPLLKLGYPDGSNRIPINPPKASAQVTPDARDTVANGSASGERP